MDTSEGQSSSQSAPSPASGSRGPLVESIALLSSTALSAYALTFAGRALVEMLTREQLPDWRIVVALAAAPVLIAAPTSIKPLVAMAGRLRGSGK